MTPRLCYAMDVPRGALLVDHAIVVETVEVDDGIVRLRTTDGEVYRYGTDERISIDEDTPERRVLLAAARALLLGEPES